MALTPRQKAVIDAFIENPIIPMAEHARLLGIPVKTIYNWKYDNVGGFKDEMERRLAEKWAEAKYMASDGMFSLAREGDFKALKYILDYSGYLPPTRVEAKVEPTEISVTID